jgi:dTDP-glucose pyrophosphorylase
MCNNIKQSKGVVSMKKPTLVVMAAGMGSRYGGLKQIDPVGPNGELIIDFSIYDAIKANFGKVVFIIKREIEENFKKIIGSRVSKYIETAYVYQELGNLPYGFELPKDRVKPWGTGHAVLSCKDIIDTPFTVINADDFYGPTSFEKISKFLSEYNDSERSYKYAMIGFKIENTLTENGTVARGVCTIDQNNNLIDIKERTKIRTFEGIAQFTEDGETWMDIPSGTTVSMNTWGFTPTIFKELEARFPKFLEDNKENILKAEYYLPTVVDELIKEGKATVKVLTSNEQWYGVTYKEDKLHVHNAINKLIKSGFYPEKLWGNR